MRFSLSPPPIFRALSVVLILYGVGRTNDVFLLIVGQLIALTTLFAQGSLRSFAKFTLSLILPVGLGLIVIWGLVRQGSPHQPPGSSIQDGLVFAVVTTLRLALFGSVFQAALVSLSCPKLVHLLQTFGVRRRALATVVSSLNLWPEFKRQVEQVAAARCARGLMPDRRLVSRLRQLPYAIRTLFISALSQAVERSDAWESSGLLARLDALGYRAGVTGDYSRVAGLAWLALSLLWATTATLEGR